MPILTLFRFTVKAMVGRLLGWEPEPLTLRLGGRRSARLAYLFPSGLVLPAVAGASPDEDDEEDGDDDHDAALDAEADAEADDDNPDDTDDEPLARIDGPLDPDRAARAIAAERAKTKKEREKRQAAEAEAAQLRQAQETEQERIERERTEAVAQAERDRERANRVLADSAIREAATEAGILPKRVGRILGEIDRTGIEVDGDDVTGAEDAVAVFVEAFDDDDRAYYLGKAADSDPDPDPDPDPEADPVPEPGGGNPDRRRKPKPITAEQADKLAATDPDKFNKLFDEGKIPASAFGGK